MSIIHGTYSPPPHIWNYIPCSQWEDTSNINNTKIHTRTMRHSFDRTLQPKIDIYMVKKWSEPSIGSRAWTHWMGASRSMWKNNIDQAKLLWYYWNFGVPKSTLCLSLNLIFLSLKRSSLKRLWGIIVVGEITKKIFRKVIETKVVKNKSGNKNYLLKDE